MALTDPSQSSALSSSLAQQLADRSASGLAQDQRSLNGLKRAAQSNPRAAVRQAAVQFNALFVQQVLKQMRDSTVKSGLFESHANDTYTSMLDQQLSVNVAQQSKGLTDVIARQLSRNLPPDPNELAAKADKAASAIGTLPHAFPVSAAATSAAPTTRATVAATASMNARLAASEAAGCAWFSGDEALEANGADPAPTTSTAATTATAQATAAAAGAAGPTSAVTTAASGSADATKAAFVARLGRHARVAEQLTGVPANFILGQAALETGWGKHEMRGSNGQSSHNLFGIKAGGDWTGKTVAVQTTEYSNGVPHRVVQTFRAYDSDADSFRDWAQLVASNPRYAAVVRHGQTASGFASGLQQAGYATDPAYRTKLIRTIDGIASAASNTTLASGSSLKSGRPTPT